MGLERKLAGHIEITRVVGTDNVYSMKIDGEEFPWYISTDGPSVNVGDAHPSVTVTLLANTIDVHHSWPAPGAKAIVAAIEAGESRDAIVRGKVRRIDANETEVRVREFDGSWEQTYDAQTTADRYAVISTLLQG